MTAMVMEKMDVIETGCGVHIVMAAAMEKFNFLVLSVAIAAAVWTNLNGE